MSGRARNIAGWLLLGLATLAVPAGGLAVPIAPDAAAFDELHRQLDDSEVPLDTMQDVESTLARLHALLPPGDAVRQRRYDFIRCFFAFSEDMPGGLAAAERGLAEAEAAHDDEAAASFHMCRGYFLGQLQSERAALPDYDAAVALARREENARLLADGLGWRGRALSHIGEQAKGLRDLMEAYRLYAASGHRQAERFVLVTIATIYRRLGEFDQSGKFLQQSLQLAEQGGGLQDTWSVEMQLGFLALDRGDPQAASAPLARAAALARQINSRLATGSVLLAQAQVDNALGHPAEALRKLATAGADFAATGEHSMVNLVAMQRGIAQAALGQRVAAERDFDIAEQGLHSNANPRYLADLYRARAQNREAMGQVAAALADVKRQMQVETQLAGMAKAQITASMSYQFDAERRELENRRLLADRKLQDERLAALERIRAWQRTTIVLAGLLIVLMAWLAWRQWREGRRLNRLAQIDPLTGISNRRHIETLLHDALAAATEQGRALTVIMLDIDHFKRVNDTHGHAVGDLVLQVVTRVCRDALRQNDALGRLGGEEFLAVLPGTDLEGARLVAERLRMLVAAASVPVGGAATLAVTVSLGVAVLKPGEELAAGLLERADAALYQAKDGGRNRTAFAP